MFSYLTLRGEVDPIRGWAGWLSVGFHATVEVFVVEQGAMMCKGKGLA